MIFKTRIKNLGTERSLSWVQGNVPLLTNQEVELEGCYPTACKKGTLETFLYELENGLIELTYITDQKVTAVVAEKKPEPVKPAPAKEEKVEEKTVEVSEAYDEMGEQGFMKGKDLSMEDFKPKAINMTPDSDAKQDGLFQEPAKSLEERLHGTSEEPAAEPADAPKKKAAKRPGRKKSAAKK